MTKLPVQADTDWMPDARHTPRVRRAFGVRPAPVRGACRHPARCMPHGHRARIGRYCGGGVLPGNDPGKDRPSAPPSCSPARPPRLARPARPR
ncbi:hypothetical protein DA2_2567 [Desulfovibrio sp. A2]|nr:hypothetical protein DA2_2567 [Desulfovibrio sp. A2]